MALIERIFGKLSESDIFPELSYPCASILFTLVKNLRDVIEQTTKLQITSSNSEMFRLFQKQQFFSISKIFVKLVDYLLNTGLSSFNVRTFLYATILNFFMIFDIKLEDSNG